MSRSVSNATQALLTTHLVSLFAGTRAVPGVLGLYASETVWWTLGVTAALLAALYASGWAFGWISRGFRQV